MEHTRSNNIMQTAATDAKRLVQDSTAGGAEIVAAAQSSVTDVASLATGETTILKVAEGLHHVEEVTSPAIKESVANLAFGALVREARLTSPGMRTPEQKRIMATLILGRRSKRGRAARIPLGYNC